MNESKKTETIDLKKEFNQLHFPKGKTLFKTAIACIAASFVIALITAGIDVGGNALIRLIPFG